jgi:CRP/FNR family cyclic AMP-dependent transcriptional regulator
MSGLSARTTDHGTLSASGPKPIPVMASQRADYLRAVTTTTPGTAADATMHALSAAHPVLGTLTEQARRALSRWSRFRTLKRREVICHQGDLPGAVILVVEGYLKRSTPLPDGNEVLLGIVGPGECAGEMAALLEQPHDANLAALSRCLLLTIDARQFRQAFDREPEGLHAIMRSTTGQLQKTTEQLLDARALSAPVRLAKALFNLPRFESAAPNGTTQLRLHLSQSELGAIAGICREVVNKHLGVWRDAGWIVMSGGAVTSFDTAAIAGMLRDEVLADAGTNPVQ